MDLLPEGTAVLWLAVIASGLYHGLNPGMGWPLAVSAGLFERRAGALWGAVAALGIGHLVAMLAILLPFGMLSTLVFWEAQIRIVAALCVLGFGLWLLFRPRHPRFLARVPPSRLALWSFLVALAHGAGLMIVPLYLGICGLYVAGAGDLGLGVLMGTGVGSALIVGAVHTVAMFGAGGAVALGVYHWLGLRFLRQSWFDLDRVWAASLALVGAVALALAL